MASPLTRLLRKDTECKWGNEEEEAFAALKHVLTTRPVLQYPDFACPFVLNTDASKVGLGAALMQAVGDKLLPVAYASSVNNQAEANFTATELECLAVIWAGSSSDHTSTDIASPLSWAPTHSVGS